MIALIALMTTVLAGLATGLVNDGISGLRNLPMTHLALQEGSENSFSRSTLTDKNLKPWKGVKSIETSKLGVSFFNAKTKDGQTIDVALFGVPQDSFLAPDKRAKESLSGKPGIVLSEKSRIDGLKVGDYLTIDGPDIKLPILGFTYTGSYGHVPIAFTSLKTWQSLFYGENSKGRFSAIAIKAEDTSEFNSLDSEARTQVRTKEASYAGSPGYSAETATMTLIRSFLLIISALIVGAFFTVWTIQRTRQIGLLKALGASNSYVLKDALGQLILIVFLSTTIGVGIGVGLGSLVGDGAPFSLEPGSVILSNLLLAVLGIAGSLVAVRRIMKVDPIIALGSEN
ncbi:MAG: ABC transporter permease [Acidimicrobiia bacterium]|nr:ABC transporter permease [Acidimicrobiia bacterium]